MTEAENLVLEHLRAMRGSLDRLERGQAEIRTRLGFLEQQYASLSVRLDHAMDDIELIKRRLDLTDA